MTQELTLIEICIRNKVPVLKQFLASLVICSQHQARKNGADLSNLAHNSFRSRFPIWRKDVDSVWVGLLNQSDSN